MQTGRIKIIRRESQVVDGRKEYTESTFYELQTGIENAIVFEVRNCEKVENIRRNLKEFSAEYKGTVFKIYDASPMFVDNQKVQLKCRESE